MVYGIEEAENYYYRLAFLDNLRAAEYLLSRQEVDPARVAAEGGSQGGLFAVALAALEPRICAVVSNVPAFAAIGDGNLLNRIGTTTALRERLEADTAEAEAMRRSLSYIDGANMIRLVRVPVQVNMGGQDPVCHFLTGMVMLRGLPADVPREFNLFPDAKHEVPGGMRAANARWVQRWMELENEPSFPGRILSPPVVEE
jgi:cephalosporin-C deacetylase-like acetyl esterase